MREPKYKQLFKFKEIPFPSPPKEWWKDYYTITTTGGEGIVYNVRGKGMTYCVGKVDTTRIRIGYNTKTLNVYKHYVLNEVGVRELKTIIIKENI